MKRIFVFFGTLLLSVGVHAADLSQGKALSSQCSVCHGKDGIAKDPESPNLAGQSALYLEKAMVDYQKGHREDRRMSIIAKSLSMEDIKNLAAWYAAFELTVKAPEL
ncbi:MAG: cytochrome c [Pseudomonadota bacterium]